jgi:hypothetical protein
MSDHGFLEDRSRSLPSLSTLRNSGESLVDLEVVNTDGLMEIQ